ncbi:hypothetical protein C2845_PM10G18810 [Panicum miliaceum]|uniref:Uncharacterized protein n=1 Tax=Panicum miliaceum TaxID=4540 RepID=A0A3L6PFJ1_PANMI|nr:hypothetical protein C2845_PM10G18810 [Panicum miliaceum]
MEEVDAIIREMKACSPSSWSSRSDAGTSGAGSLAAARSARGKQSASASTASRRYSPFSRTYRPDYLLPVPFADRSNNRTLLAMYILEWAT